MTKSEIHKDEVDGMISVLSLLDNEELKRESLQNLIVFG